MSQNIYPSRNVEIFYSINYGNSTNECNKILQQNSMYISTNKYRLTELTRQRAQEAGALLGRMFYNYNEVWNKFGPSEAVLVDYMKKSVNNALDRQEKLWSLGTLSRDHFINTMYLNNDDKLVAVWTGYQLMDYLQVKHSKNSTSTDVTQTYNQQFEDSLSPQDKVRGKTVYGQFICCDNAQNGILNQSAYDNFYHLDRIGFKTYVSRLTNKKTLNWLMTYGATITSQATIKNQDGTQITCNYVRFQIKNFLKSKHRAQHSLSKL